VAKEKKPSYSSHVLVPLFYGGFEKTKLPFLFGKSETERIKSGDKLCAKGN